jgi:hypothetical protein
VIEEGLEHYDMEQTVTGLTELIAEHLAPADSDRPTGR